jgi:periplasmic divalent cation tolerance protein
MRNSEQFGVVLVTVGSQSEAIALARSLVAQKLVACANLFPIQSIYTWQGDLCEEQEWQLVLKTKLTLLDVLEKAIQAQHTYEVPEMIALPIVAGSGPYLQWLSQQTLGASQAEAEP